MTGRGARHGTAGRRGLRLLALLAVLAGLAAVAPSAALLLAKPLLYVGSEPRPADAIVVLGGADVPRARQGARLYAAGIAPRVLVSGGSDCRSIRDVLLAEGVPRAAITVECRSTSTMENAAFSAPLLHALGVRKAVIVTSWFHTRRALLCFRSAAPEIAFRVVADADPPPATGAMQWDSRNVYLEYLKLGWYVLRYPMLFQSLWPW